MKRLSFALTAAMLSTGPMLSADDGEQRPGGREPGQLFTQLDKDGDGTLAKDEVPENQVRFFDRLVRIGDKNEDGQLSKEEFTAAMNQNEPRADAPGEGPGRRGPGGGGRPQFNAEMFNRLDANKDGKLTKDELPEQARERMGQLFERLGKDALTLEDLKAAQERFGGPGRPGGRPGEGRPGEGPRGGEFLQRLKQMDANKDGKVTLDEVPEEAKERIQQMLERTGRDAIDLEQMARMMAQGGPGRPGAREGDRPRPEGDRPQPEGREGDRPRPEAREGDRPRPEGDRPRPEFRDGDRPRPEGDRPRPEGRDGDRPRPEGDRPPMPRDGDRPPPRDGDDRPRDGFRPGGGPPLFMMLDENRDGRLDAEEFAAIAKKFGELDRNNDGYVDRAELMGFGPGGPGGGFRPREGGDRPREGFRPPQEGGRPNPEGRDGDRPRPEARDGDRPRPEGREGTRPPREGERPPREGDRPRPERPEPEREDRA